MIEGRHGDLGSAIRAVRDRDAPRLTAHLAILDVLLAGAAAGIDCDDDRFATVWAAYGCFRVCRAVSEREISIERGLQLGTGQIIVVECVYVACRRHVRKYGRSVNE